MVSDQLAQAVRLLVFCGFFIFSGICIILISEVRQVRSVDTEDIKKLFILALILGLTIPMLAGVHFPPFASWTFFTEPAPESTTQYTVVVVDGNGNEFDYPREAAAPGRVDHRGQLIATNTSRIPPDKMAKFLLSEAEEHRKDVEDGIAIREWFWYRGISGRLMGRDIWTVSEAQQMGELRGIRVYRTTINTSSDGLRITNTRQELVYSYSEEYASERSS